MLERYWVWEYGLFEKNPKRVDSLNPETTLEVVKYADAIATITDLQGQIKLANIDQANVEAERNDLQQRVADLQGQLVEWKRALHSLTPGGSEYANDSKACVEWVREARSRQHEAIIDGVKQRNDLQQRVAQLEGGRDALRLGLNALRDSYDELEGRHSDLQADHARVCEERDAWAEKAREYELELNGDPQNFHGQGRTFGLRETHARLLGLVQALPVAGLPVEHARSDDFVVLQANGEWMVHTYNYWAKFATEDEARAYIALLEYRASLPAQPAQGGA